MKLQCQPVSPSCQFDITGQLVLSSLSAGNVRCSPNFSPFAKQDGKSCCEFKPTLPGNLSLSDVFPTYTKFLQFLKENENTVSTPTLLEYMKKIEKAFKAFAQ